MIQTNLEQPKCEKCGFQLLADMLQPERKPTYCWYCEIDFRSPAMRKEDYLKEQEGKDDE